MPGNFYQEDLDEMDDRVKAFAEKNAAAPPEPFRCSCITAIGRARCPDWKTCPSWQGQEAKPRHCTCPCESDEGPHNGKHCPQHGCFLSGDGSCQELPPERRCKDCVHADAPWPPKYDCPCGGPDCSALPGGPPPGCPHWESDHDHKAARFSDCPASPYFDGAEAFEEHKEFFEKYGTYEDYLKKLADLPSAVGAGTLSRDNLTTTTNQEN